MDGTLAWDALHLLHYDRFVVDVVAEEGKGRKERGCYANEFLFDPLFVCLWVS